MTATFQIDAMGAQGDGIAHVDGEPVFIPFTLPGETVTAARGAKRADLVAVLSPSPQRVAPPCRHFGVCGGCSLQHWDANAYLDWKRRKVVDAFRSLRIDAEVAPMVPCAPHTRRRATFAARRTEAGILLGYHEAMSHRIMVVEECPILVPAIVDRLKVLRDLAAILLGGAEPIRMAVTITDSGLDVAIDELGTLSQERRLAASAFAVENRLARVSANGEIIVEPAKPQVTFGDVSVEFPPGGFLQATAEAEETMASLVTGHLSRAKRVADLFSGAGTFALRLAKRSDVHAVEAEEPPLAALDRAFRFGAGLRRVTTERRDLFRRPVTFKELAEFDGLVFDPPRAGAEDQAKQIARSTVPLVAAVSCNPVTLARDVAIMIEGGYRLKSVTPIDQFLWSPHVEAVALLDKPKKRR